MPPKKRGRPSKKASIVSAPPGSTTIYIPPAVKVSENLNSRMTLIQVEKESIRFAVPPKKRKTLPTLSISPTEPTSIVVKPVKKDIPEWLKVSIQILLINFHHEGIALLNSMESEYEDMYRKAKIDPNDYNFEDWESMLKSPQFKKHFFLYTDDKKMQYMKGLPLPRSVMISMTNNKWEIDPRIETPEEPMVKDECKSHSRASPITSELVDLDSPTSLVSINSGNGNLNSSPVVDSKKLFARSAFSAGSLYKMDSDFLSSTRVKPIATAAVTIKTLESSKQEGPLTRNPNLDPNYRNYGKTNGIGIEHNHSRSTMASPVSDHADNFSDDEAAGDERMLEKKENGRDQTNNMAFDFDHEETYYLEQNDGFPASIDENYNFFRRSDVPEEWTKSRFEDEEKYNDKYNNKDGEEEEYPLADDLVIDENHQVNNRPNNLNLNNFNSIKAIAAFSFNDSERYNEKIKSGLINEKNSWDASLEKDPPQKNRHKRYSSPPTPPPPQLHRMDIDNDIPTIKKTIAQVHQYSSQKDKEMSKEKDESNLIRSYKERKRPHPETQLTSKESSNLASELPISHIRRISQSTDEALTSPSDNSDVNSPNEGNSKKPKVEKEICDPGESFFEWKIKSVFVEELSLQSEAAYFSKLMSQEIHPETIIYKDRDPRLTNGLRKKFMSTVYSQNEMNEDNLKNSMEDIPDEDYEMPYEEEDSQEVEELIKEKMDTNGHDPRTRTKAEKFYIQDKDDKIHQVNMSENMEGIIHLEYPKLSSNHNSSSCIPMNDNLMITISQNQDDRKIKKNYEHSTNSPLTIIGHSSHKYERRTADPKDRSVISASLVKSSRSDSYYKFGLRNPIPQECSNVMHLKFEELWADTKWKNRFEADEWRADRFFNTKICEKWREIWRKELPHYRQELISELQKYEEKSYPSRCEFYLRSSLRMVEIDHMTDFQFSEPRAIDGSNLVQPDEILFYVDFAGAPGGAPEFYSKRRKWASKGFGITYQKRSYDMYSIPGIIPEYFEPFYGKLNSLNGDGSLFCSETIDIFISRVKEATKNKGVHVVTTIGNVARVVFEDDNDEKWRYQHLAQVLVALKVLREGGNMAFKMYDIKTGFTCGLLYILYKSFTQIEIAKLNIFAPTSGERAIICIGRKSDADLVEIIKFLEECHKVLQDWYTKDKFSKNKMTIEELIPVSKIEKQKEFIEYLKESNDKLKKHQLEEFTLSIRNLKIYKSIFTRALYRCFVSKTTELWKVGERSQYTIPVYKHATAAFRDLRVHPEDICEAVETLLNQYNLYSIFSSMEQWKFLPVGNSKTRGFYMGVDGIPYFFNPKHKEWVILRDYEFRFPGRTLVYAEIVSVFAQDKKLGEDVFTIIDAMVLAGKDVRNLSYSQRIGESIKFCSAITKIFFPRMVRLTVTKALEFAQLPEFLKRIESTSSIKSLEETSSSSHSLVHKKLCVSVETVFGDGVAKQRWFHPSGILFFETENGKKPFDFCSSLFSRVFWEWVQEMDLPLIQNEDSNQIDGNPEDGKAIIGSVSARKLIEFVNRYS